MIWKNQYVRKTNTTRAPFSFSWITLLIGCILGLLYIWITPPVVQEFNCTHSIVISGRNKLNFQVPYQTSDDSTYLLSFNFDNNKNVRDFTNKSSKYRADFINLRLISQFLFYSPPQVFTLTPKNNKAFAYISVENDSLFLFIRDINTTVLEHRICIQSQYPAAQMLTTQYKFLGTLTNAHNIEDRLYFTINNSLGETNTYCYNLINKTINPKHLSTKGTNTMHYSLMTSSLNKHGYFLFCKKREFSNKTTLYIANENLDTIANYSINLNARVYHKKPKNQILISSLSKKEAYLINLLETVKQGKLVKSTLHFPLSTNTLSQYSPYFNNYTYAISTEKLKKKNILCSINLENGQIRKTQLPNIDKYGKVIFAGDISGDGHTEILTTNTKIGHEALLLIAASSGKIMANIPISRESLFINHAYISNNKALQVHSTYRTYSLKVSKNKYYAYRWLWWGAILILSTLIVYFIQWITIKRQQKILFYKNQLNELHLRNLRNRFDPHFVFNAINSSSSFLLNGDRFEAYNYLSKLSQLLRFSLKNADQLTCSLKDELKNCLKYLDLQQMRFPNKFSYEVDHNNNLDLSSIEVPTGLLINLADNAIKHGFSNSKKLNKILIQITFSDNACIVAVEDDGIGRQAALANRKENRSTGTGQHIIKQYVKILNQNSFKKVDFKITDLTDDKGKASGTRCEFYIYDF